MQRNDIFFNCIITHINLLCARKASGSYTQIYTQKPSACMHTCTSYMYMVIEHEEMFINSCYIRNTQMHLSKKKKKDQIIQVKIKIIQKFRNKIYSILLLIGNCQNI